MRQWVLTVPRELRLLVAARAEVLSQVLRVFVDEVERSYLARVATQEPGKRRTGSVAFVQRFSGAMSLHPHLHVPFADGVWSRPSDHEPPVFHAAEPPTREQIQHVADRVCKRVLRWLRRKKLIDTRPVEERSNEVPEDDAVVACLRATSAQGTFAALLDPKAQGPGASAAGGHDEQDDAAFDAHAKRRTSRWSAQSDAFNVHAGTTVAAGNRFALEKLIRYCARPGVSLDRLSRLPDGRFAYRMKYPRGTKTHRVMDPMQLLASLASIVAPPHYALVRYAGCFAPGSPWRKQIVPGRAANPTRCCPLHDGPELSTLRVPKRTREQPVPPDNASAPCPPAVAACAGVVTGDPLLGVCSVIAAPVPPAVQATPSRGGGTRIPWAQLLKHGLGIDSLRCPRCSKTMEPIAIVTDPVEAKRYLAHLRKRGGRSLPERAWEPIPIEDAFDPARDELPPDDWV